MWHRNLRTKTYAGAHVAVGLLNKCMRIFSISGELKDDACGKDWIGFDGGVTAVCWSASDEWLAGVGGTCLLAIPCGGAKSSFCSRDTRVVLCRTPGTSGPDGLGGTCKQLADVVWCPPTFRVREGQGKMLAAIERGSRGLVHIFDVSKSVDDRVPRRATPIISIAAPGKGPVTSICFARNRSAISKDEDDSVLVLARGGVVSRVKRRMATAEMAK